MEHQHRASWRRTIWLLALLPLLAVERLEGRLAPLDLKLGVINHEKLLTTVQGSLVDLSFEAPLREGVERFPKDSLFVGDLDGHQFDNSVFHEPHLRGS